MCGGSCQYNYGANEFSCTCPENTYLNDDGSSCVLFENNDSKLQSTFFVPLVFYKMKDRCPKSVGDAKQTLEIRVEQRGAVRDMSIENIIKGASHSWILDALGQPKSVVEWF